MRKSLVTLLVSLALCGGATAAVIATTARAQEPRKPVMVAALVTPNFDLHSAAPPAEGGRDGGMAMPSMAMPSHGEMALHRGRMCDDRYAHEVGEMAYLETKLALTTAQSGAFDRWKSAKLAAAKRDAGDCAARPMRGRDRQREAKDERPGPLAMMAREEEMLKKRLADLSVERPALEAMYGSLTPAQRETFAEGGRGPHRMMLGMMDPMHRGMDGGPPRPPEPPPER